MGEVYKARDSRLDRVVAIKVLPAHLAGHAAMRERFEREARTVARLNHPHICTLYDIGRQAGADYLVMEYLEGETLHQRLEQGAMPLELALRFAIEMADALEQAHRKGVTHRDIKPGNIMIAQDDWLKILDFGVAKVAGQPREIEEHAIEPTEQPAVERDQFRTRPGALLGTIAYMSPEQARGLTVDARSDVYSVGVVLYEMISGRHPRVRAAARGTINALLNEDPAPLRTVAPSAPRLLERIVMRCLARDPEQRFPGMKDLKAALEEVQQDFGEAAEAVPSIAVLPFANLNADPDNEYFSDGITEDLIHALAQVPGVRVLSRTSTFQFKGRAHDLREVGRQLGVRTVLDGSVRRAGKRVRVSAQLVDVAGGASLWSERFDRELEDVFAVQDEVVRTILTTLKPKLMISPQASMAKAYTENFEAHELYLKGKYFCSQQTPEALGKALAYFERAVKLAPRHALAHVGLADTHLLRGWYGLSPASESMPQAKQAAREALRIDDALALAHCALALVESGYEWDWPEAEKRFQRALKLGPGFAAVHFHYALDYLTPLDRLQEAIQEIRIAQELDPLSLITRTALGGCFYRNHQYDAAMQQFQNTLEIDPGFYHAHWSLARALQQKYLFADAMEAFQTANRLAGGQNPLILGEMGHCRATMSEAEQARRIVAELEDLSRHSYVSPLAFAYVFTGLGEHDQAFQHLDRALEQRLRPLQWVGVDPRFECLHSDTRFSRLLGRLRLAS